MQPSDFVDRIWRYSHTFDHAGKLIKLASDGRIVGYDHPNERRWEIRGDVLLFLAESGRDTAAFKWVPHPLNRVVLGGNLVGDPAAGIKTMLQSLPEDKEFVRKSAYDMAEAVHSFAAETRVEALPHIFGTHHENAYTAKQIDLIELSDVTLRTPYAVIEKDGRIAGESLFHFPFYRETSMADGGDGHAYWMRDVEPTLEIDTALHAFGGVSENIYHWLHFFVAKMNSGLLDLWKGDRPVVLLPAFTAPYHAASAEVVAEALGLKVVRISGNGSVKVRKLLFPHQRGSEGLDIHPGTVEAFRTLKQRYQGPGAYASRVYISRSDTQNRRLVNEEGIESYLKQRGFEIVSFTGKDLAFQINTMASADYIVGPHGAGLTNVIFCKPGARILEFQSPNHFNWCMGRSASLAKAYYGAVVGEMRPEVSSDAYYVQWDKITKAVDDLLKPAS